MLDQRRADTILLSRAQVDCAVAVMLKILDGKCKMPGDEKMIMETLYHDIKGFRGQSLDHKQHDLILLACLEREDGGLSEEMIELVYEQRLYAETMISRPVMKDFKSMLRIQGILPAKGTPGDDE